MSEYHYVNESGIKSALNIFAVLILSREKLGKTILIKTARDELSPKVRALNFF